MMKIARGPGGAANVVLPANREPKVRTDFGEELERKVDQFIGPKGSDRRTVLEKTFGSAMTEGKFDLSKLPKPAQTELVKLEKAAEDFEAHFIQGLLSKMRAVSFGDKDSQITGFAKEQFDQAVASAIAGGSSSIGIGKTVFLSMGEHVVRQSVGATLTSQDDQKSSTRNG